MVRTTLGETGWDNGGLGGTLSLHKSKNACHPKCKNVTSLSEAWPNGWKDVSTLVQVGGTLNAKINRLQGRKDYIKG